LSSYDVDGSSTTKEGVEKQGIRQIIREEIAKYLQDPLGYEKEFKGWLPEWIGQAGIDVPIGQVIGYSQVVPQVAPSVETAETTTSTSFADLATVGPTLTLLPDGEYLVIWGATFDFSVGGAANAFMGVKANSSEAADSDSIFWNVPIGDFVPGARAHTFTLTAGGSNTLTARYRVTGSTGRWRNRWLVALKAANA
jgi:hypothetical protein